MEAALDLESSAFGLGGSTPLAPTKVVPAWRNGRRAAFKTQCPRTWGFDALGRHQCIEDG